MNNSRIATALWFLSIAAFIFAATSREVQPGALIFSTIVFALLTGLYLMFSDVRMAEVLPPFTRNGGEYGLPEEILFRGVIHRYLERVLRWAPVTTLILSSIIFGSAHLINPPTVGYYFILATLAGIFYGRTFLRTGKVVPAAIVHLAVDWMWSIFFSG